MGQNNCKDHGASTSDPQTVQNRVLGLTSPTSADLFEIVAFSHSEFKRPSSQTSIPSAAERLLLCKRVTFSCALFLSQEWLALSYSDSGFHLRWFWVLNECKYSYHGTFHIQYVQWTYEKPRLGLNENDIYQDSTVQLYISSSLHHFMSTQCFRSCFCPYRVATRHVKIKTQISVLNMLKRLDKIRFRGPKRDEFLDLAESPNASDSECNDDIPVKHRSSIKDTEEQRDPVSDVPSFVGISRENLSEGAEHIFFKMLSVLSF